MARKLCMQTYRLKWGKVLEKQAMGDSPKILTKLRGQSECQINGKKQFSYNL